MPAVLLHARVFLTVKEQIYGNETRYSAALFRLHVLSPRSGGNCRRTAHGPRCAVRHADGRRQIRVLSGAGTPAAGHHACHLPAHFADERSGRIADAGGRTRGIPQQLAHPGTVQPRTAQFIRGVVQARLRRAGTPFDRELPHGRREPQYFSHRRGRSALRLSVGAGLPPGLFKDCGICRKFEKSPDDRRIHRHGNKSRAQGHCGAPAPH